MENNVEEIYRELLIGIRVKSGSQAEFLASLSTIHKILENIAQNPTEPKFHSLKMQNPRIKKNIADIQQAEWLLDFVGFEQKPIEMVPHYVLNMERYQPEEFEKVTVYLKAILESKGVEIEQKIP